MKWGRIRTSSTKGKQKKRCDAILFKILKHKRGTQCEVCGRLNVAPHHIIRKGEHQSLRFVKENLILLCFRCHMATHRDHYSPTGQAVDRKIRAMLGDEFRSNLLICSRSQPKHSIVYLKTLEEALKQKLAQIDVRTIKVPPVARYGG